MAETGRGSQIAADRVRLTGLFAERLNRGAAEVEEYLVGRFDREPVLGNADEHLPAACFFLGLVAGSAHIGSTQRLFRAVQVDTEGCKRAGGGGVGIGQSGEEQVV